MAFQESAQKVLTIDDLRADKQNPRKINNRAKKGLAASMREYGDISGITYNTRTGELVCGHQRVATGRAAGATVEGDALVMPNGERFPIRMVDWPIGMQRAANVVANNQNIGGEFDESIGAMLDAIKTDMPAELFSELCFEDLDVITKELVSLLDDSKYKFCVIVETESEGAQAEILNEMNERGISCRALTL